MTSVVVGVVDLDSVPIVVILLLFLLQLSFLAISCFLLMALLLVLPV